MINYHRRFFIAKRTSVFMPVDVMFKLFTRFGIEQVPNSAIF
jgi:hypothetical protein